MGLSEIFVIVVVAVVCVVVAVVCGVAFCCRWFIWLGELSYEDESDESEFEDSSVMLVFCRQLMVSDNMSTGV